MSGTPRRTVTAHAIRRATPTVLLLNDLATIGGGQTVMLDVAQVLLEAGFETHIACPPGPAAERGRAIGAAWHDFPYSERRLLTPRCRLPRPQALAARMAEGRRLVALSAAVRADIVHTGSLIPHIDAKAAGSALRARVVWHLNQVHPSYLFAGSLPDAILGVSRASLVPGGWRSAAASRSVVVSNGVDTERFRPPTTEERRQARRSLGLGDAFTIVTVARLEPLKGVDTLIRAAARAHVRPTLVVVGDSIGYSGGPAYGDGLRTLAHEQGVDVRFLGNRSDVEALLWAGDVFGYASRWDAAPLALVEAGAAGLPVVTGNAGGCPEMIADGSTGVLLEVDDVAGFAAAFDRLAEDPHRRSALGKAGRELAVSRFDRRDFGDRLLPHYLTLLDRP